MREPGARTAGLVLAAGVAIVSTAALLVREAQASGAGALAIASGRLAIAALVVAPLALARQRDALVRLGRREWLAALGAGALLALHFAAWIQSLALTSVASSVALVTTNPIWVALGAWALLGQRPPARQWAGIALAVAGSAVLLGADAGIVAADGAAAVASDTGGTDGRDHEAGALPAPLAGDLLALAGAVAISGYLLIGRRLAPGLPLLAYVALVTTSAAAVLLAVAIAAGQPPWAIDLRAAACVVALAAGPQLLGHTAISHALRALSPGFVALAILGEPVGSALLAWALQGEPIGALQAAGFALLLAGIAVAARAERQPNG